MGPRRLSSWFFIAQKKSEMFFPHCLIKMKAGKTREFGTNAKEKNYESSNYFFTKFYFSVVFLLLDAGSIESKSTDHGGGL